MAKKISLRNLFFFATSLLLQSCYSVRQAFYFGKIYSSREYISDVLDKDLVVDETVRERLLLSQKIIKFADLQGLAVGRAYRHFVYENANQVSYVLHAAEADSFRGLTWWFPVIGSVPYLGFFNKAERDEEAHRLRLEGLDVSLGSASAFSSLGWFDDPIFESMTRNSEAEFVQLLFHELVHRTFWVKDSAAFNEGLAEFLSYKLSELFYLSQNNKIRADELHDLENDKIVAHRWLYDLKRALEKLYADEVLSREQKIEQKYLVIKRYQVENFPDFRTRYFDWWRTRKWNNASILASNLYNLDEFGFHDAWICLNGERAGSFLDRLNQAQKDLKKVDEALKSLCGSKKAKAEDVIDK